MFRIAALVAGALAGFVASLILALGGLEVTASAFGGLGERQLALARFGLIFIANLSLLGAGVSLALPRAGAILLFLAGATWAGAALYLGHKTDMVLFGPPALALLGVLLAIVGDIRGRRSASGGPMIEPRTDRYAVPDPYDVAPVAVRGSSAGMAPLPTRDPLEGLSDREMMPSRLTGRNDRKIMPPPTATPTFRDLDDEDDEEEYEPSLLRRLGSGLTNVLSFGLYAAAAASVLLVIYNLYQRENGTALVTNPAPKAASSQVAEVTAPPSSSLQPVAPAPIVVVRPPPSPAPSSSAPPAAISTALAPTPSSAPEPVRVVGEPAPDDAVPATPAAPATPSAASSTPEPAPSSQPSSQPVAVAETTPLPEPDFVDNTKNAPIPAVMSPELAAARRAGTFDNVQPDSFAVAPAFSGSDI